MLIDTHCHLNLDQFDNDLPDVISRAKNAGITKIIVPGINLETSKRAVQISENYEEVFAAVGLHPNEIGASAQNDIAELQSFLDHPKVIALGEIGLDFYHDCISRKAQEDLLIRQLTVADQRDIPVILHSRNSLSRLNKILRSWISDSCRSTVPRLMGVMHSFEGNFEEALEFYQMGFMISLNGNITFKNAHTRHVLANEVPLKALVLETDSPFLSPIPFRGRRNEPAHLSFIAQRLAEIKQITRDEIEKQTTINAEKVFQIKS